METLDARFERPDEKLLTADDADDFIFEMKFDDQLDCLLVALERVVESFDGILLNPFEKFEVDVLPVLVMLLLSLLE